MSAPPPIGALRTRLQLEQPVDTPDDTGAFTRSWTPVASLWGKVVPRGGNQDFAADAIEAAISHVVTIRARPDVANGMRFTTAGRALLIWTVIDPEGDGRTLVCRCEEFAP